MNPKISICVPNLNMRPFLEERFASILNQTFADWELLVYDSFSDDGAWEYLQDVARREKRMRLWQGPRAGIYPAWNECIRECRGEYVYIATSDDTMAPDCLGKLAAALDKHPECDLAHCPVRVIDEQGGPISFPQWPGSTAFAIDDIGWVGRQHVRKAPYDGLLHLTGMSVYLSMVQLLIRRTLFEKIGPFQTRWGSAGDVNWQMKAGLIAHTVHVPDTWSAWRIHEKQATDLAARSGRTARRVFDEMIDDAIETSLEDLEPSVAAALKTDWLAWFLAMRDYEQGMESRSTVFQKRLFQAAQLSRVNRPSGRYLLGRICGRPEWLHTAPQMIRRRLESLGIAPVLIDDSAQ